MTALSQWEMKLGNRLITPEYDLRVPHHQFRYPRPGRSTAKNSTEALTSLHTLLLSPVAGAPKQLSVFLEMKSCMRSWIQEKSLAGKNIGLFLPAPKEIVSALQEAHCKAVHIPDDPSLIQVLLEDKFTVLDAICLINPNRVSGFFYNEDLYASLFQTIKNKYPKVPYLLEESAGIFSLGDDTPASLKSLIKFENIDMMGSLFPFMAPQGSHFCWLLSSTPHPTHSELSTEELLSAEAIMQSFSSKQGALIAEFQRILLTLKRNVRVISDELRPLLTQKDIHIPFWPECGFYLGLDLSKILSKSKLSLEECVLRVAEKHGVLLEPGHLYLRPSLVYICFAAPESYLKRAGKRLCEALEDLLQ